MNKSLLVSPLVHYTRLGRLCIKEPTQLFYLLMHWLLADPQARRGQLATRKVLLGGYNGLQERKEHLL
jgi:hypothetical protein